MRQCGGKSVVKEAYRSACVVLNHTDNLATSTKPGPAPRMMERFVKWNPGLFDLVSVVHEALWLISAHRSCCGQHHVLADPALTTDIYLLCMRLGSSHLPAI